MSDKNAIKKSRHEFAKARNLRLKAEKERAMKKLTPAERIRRLDFRLGEGVGAEKERRRFTK